MLDISGRVTTWKTGLLIIGNNPIIGVGPNTFYKRMDVLASDYLSWAFIHPEKTYSDYVGTTYKGYWTLYNPHNIFMMVSAEYGLSGFLLFMCIIAGIVRRILLTLKVSSLSVKDYYYIKGFLWGIIAYLIQNTKGSFIVDNHRASAFFWLYVGIALCLTKVARMESRD